MSSLPVSSNDPLSTVVVEEPYEHLLGGERLVESVEPRLCCVGHDVVLALKYKVPVGPLRRAPPGCGPQAVPFHNTVPDRALPAHGLRQADRAHRAGLHAEIPGEY